MRDYDIYSVEFATDGKRNIERLPEIVRVSKNIPIEDIADLISDKYGFLVTSLQKMKRHKPNPSFPTFDRMLKSNPETEENFWILRKIGIDEGLDGQEASKFATFFSERFGYHPAKKMYAIEWANRWRKKRAKTFGDSQTVKFLEKFGSQWNKGNMYRKGVSDGKLGKQQRSADSNYIKGYFDGLMIFNRRKAKQIENRVKPNPTISNSMVIAHFIEGDEHANSGHLSITPMKLRNGKLVTVLYTYAKPLAIRYSNDGKTEYYVNTTRYSVSSTRQKNILVQELQSMVDEKLIKPLDEEAINGILYGSK